ncbi:MAG: 23S rRNA (pseudouridine(1915)-N(3))-methyltransferase RlmH [Candidatus Paceibacterota bacterium]
MKLLFLTVGKENKDIYQEAINEYTKRLSHYVSVEWKYLKNSTKGGEVAKTEEAEIILKNIGREDFVVLLDEKGKEMRTKELSDFFDKKMQSGEKRVVFIIGGAFGVSELVKKAVQMTIALSQLTFPHELVRLILVEQIYRAFTILKGEKYHHE